MQIDLNTLQQCKFKSNDVYEIYYNNVKIWPIETSEPILNFIDPVPEGDYLSFAPVINTDDVNIKMKHWNVDFKIFWYSNRGEYYTNLFNNTNGIVFGEKRIDKFINGQFIEGTWQPIRFEEDVNIYYNEILRVRYDRLNVNWNDVIESFIPRIITKVNITTVCLLKQNNSYSVVNDECYIYGKLKTFKDNTGKYIDNYVDYNVRGGKNRFFADPGLFEFLQGDYHKKYEYKGDDFVHEHNVIYHPTHKLELLDPTLVLDGALTDNINAKCYNYISFRNFSWDKIPSIINNLELEFTENINDDWFNKWGGLSVKDHSAFFNPAPDSNGVIRVYNLKIIDNEFVNNSNLKYALQYLFEYNFYLEYVKLDYAGVLNADSAEGMFKDAGKKPKQPVLVKRGGASTVDREAIGFKFYQNDRWIIKDFNEE